MYCYELMKIPSFKNINLVAGRSGLNKKVSWVYVLQTSSLENWVHGGEILFIVNTKDIRKTLEDAVSHNISCAIVLKNKDNQSILNDRILRFADKKELPLFEMDYDIKIIDVTREISTYIVHKQEKIDYLNYFFYKVLLSEGIKNEDLEEFSVNYGFQSNYEFFTATIQCNDIARLNSIKTSFNISVAEEKTHFLCSILNARLVILAFGLPAEVLKSRRTLFTTFHELNERFPDLLMMGIGSICASLREVHCSYMKAIKALSLSTKENRITDYEDLGFSRLLLNAIDTRELKEYATHILGPVKAYDAKNQTFFLQTIEAYVLCNGNINRISTQIHVHRNTCIYRVGKIKELFQIDLENPYVRADILNSLSIYRYLGI